MTEGGRRVERKTNLTIEGASVSSFPLGQFELRWFEVWTITERHTVTSSTSDFQYTPQTAKIPQTHPCLSPLGIS